MDAIRAIADSPGQAKEKPDTTLLQETVAQELEVNRSEVNKAVECADLGEKSRK